MPDIIRFEEFCNGIKLRTEYRQPGHQVFKEFVGQAISDTTCIAWLKDRQANICRSCPIQQFCIGNSGNDFDTISNPLTCYEFFKLNPG